MKIREKLRQIQSWLLVIVVVMLLITLGTNKTQPIISYTTKAKSVPTLARIGSELEFDYTTCPPSSAMLNSSYTTPLHDDCPHVFIIGARKGATTSMYQYLSSHPDFGGVRLKRGQTAGETYFFSWRYNLISWSKYVSEFPADKMSGDSSVANLVYCKVAQRLYSNCGRTAKVIVLLRDPVERFQSDFRMRLRQETMYSARTNISNAVDKEIKHFKQRVAFSKRIDTSDLSSYPNELRCLYGAGRNIMFDGMYYVHLHNWLCNFPAENILILNTEQFHDHTVDSLAKVMEFVGLRPLTDDKMKNITSVVYNSAGRLEDELPFKKLSKSDRKKLMTIYESFNNKLFQLLKWNNVKWNELSE